jgi:phytoene synthase
MSLTSSGSSATRNISRALTKASRSNFYYAFLFLPKPKREALYAVYAFCRVTDDLVDEALPVAAGADLAAATPGLERLKCWRAELESSFRGEARHPVTQRLTEVIRDFRIPHSYFEELLNGVEMDLTKSRYTTFAELRHYCYRVAGVIGLMCIEIFGYRQPATRDYAEHLGTAFQLTNILRDLPADADRGRIYLPQEDLQHFGYSEQDLLERRITPVFSDLMRFEVERARQFYAAARASLPEEDRRSMLAAEIMGAIYSRILRQIEARGYDVFSSRVHLSDAQRLWLALACWAKHRLGAA